MNPKTSETVSVEKLLLAQGSLEQQLGETRRTIGAGNINTLLALVDAELARRREDGDIEADTGNEEVDRVLRRLASSDPDFDDCMDAAVLIRKLEAEHRGPSGFATWKDAAFAERLKHSPSGVALTSDMREALEAGADALQRQAQYVHPGSYEYSGNDARAAILRSLAQQGKV
jgi:hypothetical protein